MSETMGSLNASLAQKLAGKFDPDLEQKLLQWISKMVNEDLSSRNEPLQEILKDGTILCRLMNQLVPNAIKRINTSKLPFKQMENISNYVTACEALGLTESERFQTLDLFEAKDIVCVMNHLRTLKILSEKNGGDLSGFVTKNPSTLKKSNAPVPCPSSPISKSPKRSSIGPDGGALKSKWSVGSRSSLNASQADSPSVSSLHDDISTKEEFKYSPELEDGAKKWIRQLLQDDSLFTKESLANALKSGVILCRCINAIQPGTISKINTSSFNYAQMENIGNYLKACVTLGLPKTFLFDTPDLWDKKNMNLVINNIHVLAKHVENKLEGYSGPKIDDTSQVRTLYSSALSEKQLSTIMGSEDEEREMGEDEKEMVVWMNSQLSKKSDSLCVPHLSAHSIRTGVVLIQLLEILTKMETIGFYEANPQILWHCMQNASLVLRFIYQQTFVELDCKAQEIVLGRVESLIYILRFLRDKFDVDYLFLTVLNEGEEDKLSLEDMVGSEEDKETKAEREKIARIGAEIAELQRELEEEEEKTKSPSISGGKTRKKTDASKSAKKRKRGMFSDAISSMAEAADSLSKGEEVPKEKRMRPADMDKVKVVPTETKKLSAFDKILGNITEDGAKKSLFTKTEEETSTDNTPTVKSGWKTASKPMGTRSDFTMKHQPVQQREMVITQTEAKPSPNIDTPGTGDKAESTSEESESSEISESTESSEYETSTEESYESSEEEETPVRSKAIQQRQQRIQQLHKDQEEAAHRAKELQTKKQQQNSTPSGNDQTKERVLKAQNVVRKKVASELLQTEQNYLKSLQEVVSGLIYPLKAAERSTPILNNDEFHAVFANLQELSKQHKDLLKTFEDRIAKQWSDKATVGDIFIQKMNIFRHYREYLINYNISIVALQTMKQNNNAFKALVNKFQRIQMKTSRLSLESFLIMPVQRIPRYLLLLADIKKYTASTHPDYEFLTIAIETLKATLQSHNSGIDPKASQYAQKLLAVASSIENVEAIPSEFTQGSLVQSGRRLLVEGRINVTQKIGANIIKKDADVKHYGFLFNDLLLLCIEKNKDNSEHPFLYVSGLPIKDLTTQKEGRKKIIATHSDKTWEIEFQNNKARSAWLTSFESLK